ncbi:MAG: TetR/AcrR family transcriptional regulator [Anaeromyxobacter sp.]
MSPTHDAIAAAARDLLLEGGVGALSMRRVADRVGVSATAIYRHFDGKEALLVAALARGGEVLRARLARALRGRTPAERLVRTGREYLRFAFTHPHDYRLVFMAWDDLAGMGLPRARPGELSEGLRFLVERVAECRAAGLVRSGAPDLELALRAWATVHGWASLWLAGGAGRAVPLAAWRRMAYRAVEASIAAL